VGEGGGGRGVGTWRKEVGVMTGRLGGSSPSALGASGGPPDLLWHPDTRQTTSSRRWPARGGAGVAPRGGRPRRIARGASCPPQPAHLGRLGRGACRLYVDLGRGLGRGEEASAWPRASLRQRAAPDRAALACTSTGATARR